MKEPRIANSSEERNSSSTGNKQKPSELWEVLSKKNWEESAVSFYVGYRKLGNKKPYKFYSVNAEKSICNGFIKTLCDKFKQELEFKEYEYSIPSTYTTQTFNVSKLNNQVTIIDKLNPDTIPVATQYSQLTKSEFYVVSFCLPDIKPLYAFCKLERAYNPKPKFSLTNMLWETGVLMAMDKQDTFNIGKQFNYIVWDDNIYIFDQKNFEYILDIRDELLNKSSEIINELANIGIIANPADLKTFVGSNLRNLRRIIKIKQSNYYSDETYRKNLLAIIPKKKTWNIQLSEDGKQIIVTEDNMNAVIKVLTNSRLKSEINDEEFDAEIKSPITP